MRVAFRPINMQFDWGWIYSHIPLNRMEHSNGIIAYNVDTNQPIAAMICENWSKTSVECHFIVANRAALRHKFHEECANFVFTTAGKLKMFGRVPEDNTAARKLNKHFGFKELITLKDAFDVGDNVVIMELNREDCPYWTWRGEQKHG